MGWPLILTACGGASSQGGEEFVGTYQVSAHHQHQLQGSTVACSDPGPVVASGPPYIALLVDPFFNDPHTILRQSCTAPAGACTDTDDFTTGGPGLEQISENTQTGGGTTCNLYATYGTITLEGTSLHMELRNWFATTAVAADCTLDHAKALRSSPDCYTVETMDATRTP